MEFTYTKTLGLKRQVRYDPLVQIELVGRHSFSFYCLIDSGSADNLFTVDHATQAGIDLSNTRKVKSHIGGETYDGYVKNVTMKFIGKKWRANVVFCDRGDGTDLLGGHGFFQYFTVRFRYFERAFDVTPRPDLRWR